MAEFEDKAKQQAEVQEAGKQAQQVLNASNRPKNFAQGATSGLSNIVAGAVGGVGVAILAPTVGLAAGAQKGGVLGGVVGFTGGAVVGVVGGAGVIVGGAISGASQIVRGVAATPQAIIAPRQGKWWNEVEGKWVYTDLPKDFKALGGIPEDDSDLLGKLVNEVEGQDKINITSEAVKETYYYDVLEVGPTAEPSAIKRKYYVQARKYHPDKVGNDNREAADKFKEIAEAYQVLSDPELRAKYDAEGREGLSPDKTSVAEDAPQADPSLLFAFLFGSDKFNDYIGRLATATSASVGDSPKVTIETAREIQKRRVLRLAVKLTAKLQKWAEGDHEQCRTMWKMEANDLAMASYGIQLVQLIGKVYNLAAVQFLGSSDSGVGMPSIGAWAKNQKAKLERSSDKRKAKVAGLKTGVSMFSQTQKLEREMAEATTDEDVEAVKEKMEKVLVGTTLEIMWTTISVDIASTLHETVQLVLFDQSVGRDVRKKRAQGIKALGEIFMECPLPESASTKERDAREMFEEATFAATVETIKRKEEARQQAEAQ